MTWSIIARDDQSGRVGIAVATRFFAVGAAVPHIRTGVGAIATQALVNQSFGPRGLDLMAAGASADETLKTLIDSDAGRGRISSISWTTPDASLRIRARRALIGADI